MEKFIQKGAVSVYLFGSAAYKANPNDFDLAVIYNKGKDGLNKEWLETIKDFEENIEIHFFQKEEDIGQKLEKCFKLYRERKEDCEELINSIFNNFLRIYISYAGEIPGSKHSLAKQAKKAGLDIKKMGLWERLEWMEKTIKKIKTNF